MPRSTRKHGKLAWFDSVDRVRWMGVVIDGIMAMLLVTLFRWIVLYISSSDFDFSPLGWCFTGSCLFVCRILAQSRCGSTFAQFFFENYKGISGTTVHCMIRVFLWICSIVFFSNPDRIRRPLGMLFLCNLRWYLCPHFFVQEFSDGVYLQTFLDWYSEPLLLFTDSASHQIAGTCSHTWFAWAYSIVFVTFSWNSLIFIPSQDIYIYAS